MHYDTKEGWVISDEDKNLDRHTHEYEPEAAVVILLAAEVLILIPRGENNPPELYVNTWDGPPAPLVDSDHEEDFWNLWDAWKEFGIWGAEVWLARREEQRPPVYVQINMKGDGAWPEDMDTLKPHPLEKPWTPSSYLGY